mmetsp:Transcript_16240/g.51018  ORF Transcript_16240/g.51018 Transcript_16240/m.51018 type:complete len:312 (-) Transcript_16240:2200-3135(-)
MFLAVVGQVQVVCLRREFRSQGIDLLHCRVDPSPLPQPPHVLLLHAATCVGFCAPALASSRTHGWGEGRRFADLQLRRYLPVGKATTLRLAEHCFAALECLEIHGPQGLFHAVNVVQLGQEPVIDLREVVDLRHGHPQFEGFGHAPHADGRRLLQLHLHRALHVCHAPVPQLDVETFRIEASATLVHHAKSLLNRLLECPAYGHDLAYALHARSDCRVHGGELPQVPTGNLGNDVVQGGLETCSSAEGHAVPEFHEIIAQRQLRGHVGQGVARGLRSQCATPREPCIDLDNAELLALGVHGILNVAFAHHA